MIRDLFEFFYITNRPVTVICLSLMFPLDIILFWLMSRYGFWIRLVFGLILFSFFCWNLSWFAEPPRGFSYEQVFREFALICFILGKISRVYQFLHNKRVSELERPVAKPITPRDRSISILAGILGSLFAFGIIISYWLFSVYSTDKLSKQQELAAIDNQTKTYQQVAELIAEFKASQAQQMAMASLNHSQLVAIEEQGRQGIALATQAAQQASTVKSDVRKLKTAQAEERRGKTIQAKSIDKAPKANNSNFLQRLWKRFSGVPIPIPQRPDSTHVARQTRSASLPN